MEELLLTDYYEWNVFPPVSYEPVHVWQFNQCEYPKEKPEPLTRLFSKFDEAQEQLGDLAVLSDEDEPSHQLDQERLATMEEVSPVQYAVKFRSMLLLEKEEEQERKLSQTLSDVEVRWYEKELRECGTVILELEQAAKLSVGIGDVVVLSLPPRWEGKGVIFAVEQMRQICFYADMHNQPVPVDSEEEKLTKGFTVQFEFNSVAYRRMLDGLYEIENSRMDPVILSKLLSKNSQTEPLQPVYDPIDVPGSTINESQKRALHQALNSRFLLIQGPPGTGKTSTSAAIVYNLLKQRRNRILVCASSNTAVDNLARRIYGLNVDVIRCYSRVIEEIDDPSRAEDFKLHRRVSDILRQILQTEEPELEPFRLVIEKAFSFARCSIKEEILLNTLKYYIQDQLIKSADVVCCTCLLAFSKKFKRLNFKRVLIDEATQSKEPEIILPMLLGAEQVILVGDHKQLGPTIVSDQAKELGLGLSLFERAANTLNCELALLKVQYRMHPAISRFSNQEFYDSKLLDGVEATDRVYNVNLPWPNPVKPVAFVKVQGPESKLYGDSLCNQNEAMYIVSLCLKLLQRGVRCENIGVISMYKAQIYMILGLLFTELANMGCQSYIGFLEVSSVDSFQGREKDFIIISCVRSNHRRTIGFLKNQQRLNVAITRAKYGMVIVGDPDTLSRDPTWRRLIDYYRRNQALIHPRFNSLF